MATTALALMLASAAFAARAAAAPAAARPRADVRSVAISPDETVALAGDIDGSISEFALDRNAAKLAEKRAWDAGVGTVWGLAFAAQGRRVVAAGDRGIAIFAYPSLEFERAPEQAAGVTALALFQDGRLALTGAADGAVRLWDLEAGSALAELGTHGQRVYAALVLPGGARGLSGSEGGSIKVWDLSRRALETELETSDARVFALAASTDGARVLAAGGELTMWESRGWTRLRAWRRNPGSTQGIHWLGEAQSALAAGCNKTVTRWRVDRDAPERLAAFATDVHATALTRDGRILVLGHKGGDVRAVRVPGR